MLSVCFDSTVEGTDDKKHYTPVSITATYTSTMAEEVIALLRRLHVLPVWNAAINKYIANQLPNIVTLLAEKRTHHVSPIVSQNKTHKHMYLLYVKF